MTTIAPRLYVDSADVDKVDVLLRTRVVHGVTTNPTILERASRSAQDIPDLYARWVAAGAHEVFFQTWGDDSASLLRNAETIRALGDRVAVKVPATRAGFTAAAHLVDDGATVLVTAVYSVAQALVCASLGAQYIAPYFGRMRDAGIDAATVIADMERVCENSPTHVLAASLRAADDITSLRLAGISCFTAAPEVIDSLMLDDVSERSANVFEETMLRLGG